MVVVVNSYFSQRPLNLSDYHFKLNFEFDKVRTINFKMYKDNHCQGQKIVFHSMCFDSFFSSFFVCVFLSVREMMNLCRYCFLRLEICVL